MFLVWKEVWGEGCLYNCRLLESVWFGDVVWLDFL